MTDIGTLCTRLNLDDAAVRRVLDSERAAGRSAPWYVQALLGLGAWITAAIMIVFIAVFLDFALDVNEPGLGSAAIGAVMFAGGLLIQAKSKANVFAEQFAIAVTAAGAAVAAVSLWFEFDSAWIAAALAAAMTTVDIAVGRHAQQQFLLAALAIGIGIAALADAMTAPQVNIVALAAPIGALLYVWPPRKDVRPTATALLLTMPGYELVVDGLYAPVYGSGGWIARIVTMITVLGLAALRARDAAPKARPALLLVGLIAAAICLLLPPGGSAALVILMLAFTLGHWPLAIVGVLLEIYFVPRFYYDLDLTLLDKSWILLAVGGALLAACAVLRRSGAAPS